MNKILALLSTAAALIIFVLLLWYVSVPQELIEKQIKRSIARSLGNDITVEITGLSKGPLFTLHFDRIEIYKDTLHALTITDLSTQINPLYIYKKNIELSLNGKIGTGDIRGTFLLPDGGSFSAQKIELASIHYLKGLGIESSGYLSADAILNKSSSEIRFTVGDLNISKSPLSVIPLISSFKSSQGMLTVAGDKLSVRSLSLDGDKGYARAKGYINKGMVDMKFEFMPEFGKLEEFEKILIKQYESSPGYYVFPYRGSLPI